MRQRWIKGPVVTLTSPFRSGYCGITPNTGSALNAESVADDEFDAEWLGTGLQNVDGLRQTGLGNKWFCSRYGQRLLLSGAKHRTCAWLPAAAVASSSSDAFAISMPVRSMIMVWKFNRASRRPCAISA